MNRAGASVLVALGVMVRVLHRVGGVPRCDQMCRVLHDLGRPWEQDEREDAREQSDKAGHGWREI